MSTSLTIKNLEYNEDLVGYILTLSNNKIVQIQFNLNPNRLDADFNTHYAVIDKQNDYDLNLNDDEEEQVKQLIAENIEIATKAEELDNNLNHN